MRLRVLAVLAVLGLALGLVGSVQAADKPTVIVRVNSIDSLVKDAAYLGKLAGQEDMIEQFEGLYKSMVGPKGLEGFDPKQPVGMYVTMGADIADSDFVVLLPVANAKAVIDLLDRQGIDYEKQDGGVYKVALPGSPFPGYFRFQNGYAYMTVRDAKYIAPKHALKPGDVLGKFDGVASISINLDTIPEQTRELILGQMELGIEQAKDQAPGAETEAQKKLRIAAIDTTYEQFKTLIEGGGDMTIDFGIDRKNEELTFDFTLGGKKGSELAKSIAALGKVRSLGAALMNDGAAASDYIKMSLPEKLQKAIAPAYEEIVEQALESINTEAQKKVAKQILGALGSTVKAGTLDAGGQLVGPNDKGNFTLVAGIAVKDGLALEKGIKNGFDLIPNEAREQVKLMVDRAKVSGVNVHSFTPPVEGQEGQEMKRIFGDDVTVYFALRDDALFVTVGANAMDAMKKAIATKPAVGSVAKGEVSVANLIKLAPENERRVPEGIAKDVFGKNPKGDKIMWNMTGGEKFHLSIKMQGKLIEFFAKIGQAQAEF